MATVNVFKFFGVDNVTSTDAQTMFGTTTINGVATQNPLVNETYIVKSIKVTSAGTPTVTVINNSITTIKTATLTANQTEELLLEIKKYDLQDAIVKIVYHLPENTKSSVDLAKIEKECSNAIYIVGIIPVLKTTNRSHRITQTSNFALPELLDAYFSTRPELKNKKKILTEKALSLYEQSASE